MNNFTEFLKTLGPARIVTLGIVTAGLLGFFTFVGLRVSEPPMALLFSDLTQEDASRIIAELDTLNIPFQLRGNGSRIMVPENRALRLRLDMAEKGLPAGSTIGYEIFDDTDSLGTTSFVQNLNHLRALEGELARTIRAINKIDAARVHLVLPEREVFSRTKATPSASIVLRVLGSLNTRQVQAIQYLVASAVEGLSASNVSIVDERGNLLTRSNDADTPGAIASSLDERNMSFENRIRQEIVKIVESVVGKDNARVRVSAELDFNRVTRTSDRYDPEGQVVRSTQTVEENSSNEDGSTNDGVSVSNNVPDASFGDSGNASSNREASNRIEETVNYEISRVTETETLEAGRIKRISVAVLVDGTYESPAEEGAAPTYTPRSQDDLEKINTLVRTAIGFNNERGDQVEVINLKFAAQKEPEPLETIEESFFSLTKADYFRITELGVLAIVSLLVLLLVVRPIIRRLLGDGTGALTEGQLALTDGQLALTDGGVNPDGTTPQLTGPTGAPAVNEDGSPIEALGNNPDSVKSRVEAMINLAQVEGEVRESSLKKVGELVASYPEETMGILRNWLYQEA